MQDFFDFSLEPGKILNKTNYIKNTPDVSIIMPFYNSKNYIEQSVKSVLNQTFPYFELIIVDDGSKDIESLNKLKEIEHLDDRIKVYHKENEGLAATRDYGVSKSCESAKYLMFLDDDDLSEPTYLECAYWTLETNKGASWAYTDSVGFESIKYTWNKWFNAEKLKKENELISAAVIRKEAFEDVGGYGIREKAVNEDWNFWLKLIAKGRYPVHMSFYGTWYRRKENGELKRSINNRKRSLEIINETAKTINETVNAIQYPRFNYDYDILPEKIDGIKIPKSEKNEKINILMMFPWMVVGGADKFNLDLIKGLDKEKYNITVLLTEPNKNILRQEFEKYCTVYDLTTFIDKKYWLSFINYIIEKNNINLIFNTNSKFGYSVLPYLKAKYNLPIIDYIHMEEWYYRNGGFARYSANINSVIDKTLTCNENTKRVLNQYFKVQEDKVETVYIGVDEKKYDPNKYNASQILDKYGIVKDNRKIISYICRISEQKRPMLLLEIVNRLKDIRKDILFLVVGNGNLLASMKEKVKKLELDKYITFLDYTNHTEEIYKISDLTINCSLKEGLALTSYESLSMGVPVISSDVGGQKELINEDVGAIVPCLQKETDIYNIKYSKEEIENYINAIEKIINNLDSYKEKCRNRILKEFTIEKMVERMSNIFEEISTDKTTKMYNVDIAKELICTNIMSDKLGYEWECLEYEKTIYGRAYSKIGMNYKNELLKEKLWKSRIWRILIKIYHKIK